MKRRHRKRSSKAANPATPKIPSDAEKPAEPSAALAGTDRQTPPRDEFIAPVEVEQPAEPSAALAGTDYVIDLGDEFIATVEEEKAAGDSFALADLSMEPRHLRLESPTNFCSKGPSRSACVPLRPAIHRLRSGPAQATLGQLERRSNVKGAFAGIAGSLRGLHVGLVDDVATTGATLLDAAAAARACGARGVRAYVVAFEE